MNIGGKEVDGNELKEHLKFVANMLRAAADQVEKGERKNLDWEDRLIFTYVPDYSKGHPIPKRRIDGYECRVKLWDEPGETK